MKHFTHKSKLTAINVLAEMHAIFEMLKKQKTLFTSNIVIIEIKG